MLAVRKSGALCSQRPTLVAAFAVLALVAATPMLAQQRPLITEDPRVIPYGAVTTELGFGYAERARFPVSGLGGDHYALLVNGLHVGIGPKAEFQIGGVAHNVVRVRENGSGWRNDWGDFWLSTKIVILDERGLRPIITFRPMVVLPNTNNEKGLGTDGTHFFGSLLFGKTVGPVFVFANAGLGILDDAVRAAAQQDVVAAGIAASVRLHPRLNLVGEWNGLRNPQENPSPGGEDRGQARLGFQWDAAGGRWDLAATAGTTPLDHRVGVVVGFTKTLQLWR